MKKPDNSDQIRAEYRFENGRRGRYARRYAEGTNIVRLDADVATAFPSSEAVNDALRKVASAPHLLRGTIEKITIVRQVDITGRHRNLGRRPEGR
ncbi:MAG TPA: hypothetical protein VHT05_00815 [Candidatus Elarobacter sp.]|nr:hypothetical protein [Candidatus Elarobacter sp.]